MRPVVLKFGGSLLDCAAPLVAALANTVPPCPILIVPGGGPFAHAVRALDPGPDTAHWMAVAAMEQVGHYLAGFGLQATDALVLSPDPTVFLPYCRLRDRDPLPHSWHISSDTIAAWCAAELGADLILAKSIDGVIVDGRLLEVVDTPIETDAVDPCLIPFALAHGLRVGIVNARAPGRLLQALRGNPVPCTRIDPSLFVGRA